MFRKTGEDGVGPIGPPEGAPLQAPSVLATSAAPGPTDVAQLAAVSAALPSIGAVNAALIGSVAVAFTQLVL
jgi:hypothetical protein